LVQNAHAEGYFARRNISRRLYYKALKDANKDAANLEPLNADAKPTELQYKLKELITASNFVDATSSQEDASKNKKDKASPVGEVFDEATKNKVVGPQALSMVGEVYANENVLKLPKEEGKEEKKVHMRKKKDRRRKRRRKNNIRSRTAARQMENKIGKDQAKSTTKDQLEKDKTDDENVNKETVASVYEKSPKHQRFNWQKPIGQWHKPTGQFQPILGNFETFDRSKRKREDLVGGPGMKLMVYTGQLDKKIKNYG